MLSRAISSGSALVRRRSGPVTAALAVPLAWKFGPRPLQPVGWVETRNLGRAFADAAAPATAAAVDGGDAASAAEAAAAGRRAAAAEGDAGVRMRLRDAGCAAAASHAFDRFGRYSTNEKAWQAVCQQILNEGAQDLASMDPVGLKSLVRVLAEDARVTRGAFWSELTEKVLPVLEACTLEDLTEVAELYASIRAWQRLVFLALIRKVRAETAVHWMKPADLVRLLAVFSRAGSGSKELSVLTTTLFNEMQERVLEDIDDFEVEDCIGLLSSMARFGAVKTPVLQVIGREKIHPAVTEGRLHGPRATEVCHSYGELGYRHDTVFRTVVEEVLREHEELQRARVLGEELPAVRYTASHLALITQALLSLKMYRGNTTWFKWGDRYRDLLDVLTRRLEVELPTVSAKNLAAASFVLGRARRGSVVLYNAMYARMMELLERSADAVDPPQDHLATFLHGLAMMGPERQKKDLEVEWLLQWLCNNVYTFALSDFIMVNRHLVMMRAFDREYLQMLVPFYCEPERMKQLSKTDVQELTHTYNGARIYEADIPDGMGRHFFWALGRQYQTHQIERTGGRGRRPALRRLG